MLPDFASVNWHEDGSTELAADLLDRGVGVEAGLWTPAAVRSWRAWPHRGRCLRVLLEVMDDEPHPVTAAAALVDTLGTDPGVPILLHGEGTAAWPVLREAGRRGLDTRIGLEDTLVLPDGSPAPDNAALVTAALALLHPGAGA
ncbi:MAG TPA: 3-keto-5-aminohexanoate cleavage protein [Blastococcus sp.]|nr:3-keto-5-aminohexanoate cleavage protein [Blastococcus sp.]